MYSQHTAYSQRGFTLIELMIGLVLGLLILGGVISIFIANGQIARASRDMNNAQEAFRFATYTISRVVRNSDGFSASDDQTLVVNDPSPDPEDPSIVNCLGAPASGGTSTFIFQNGQLRCNDGTNNEILAEGFDMAVVRFDYGVWDVTKAHEGRWIPNAEYKSAADINNISLGWNNVISVRVTIQTTAGLSTVFTAASRQRVLVE